MAYTSDTIFVPMTVKKTISDDTVRVYLTVVCSSLVDNGDGVTDLLEKVIPDAAWSQTAASRSVDSAGIENLTVHASARVKSSETAHIQQRVIDARRPGMNIQDYRVDNTMRGDFYEKAETDARFELIEKAYAEAARLREVTNLKFRVHSIDFTSNEASHAHSVGMAAPQTARAYSVSHGSSLNTNTVVINKTARVVFINESD